MLHPNLIRSRVLGSGSASMLVAKVTACTGRRPGPCLSNTMSASFPRHLLLLLLTSTFRLRGSTLQSTQMCPLLLLIAKKKLFNSGQRARPMSSCCLTSVARLSASSHMVKVSSSILR
ncbi:hypothetical protein IEO21_10437 [Rhodonia placenta]|uniref:Uncharacterized protein n=1 Tax=Rhodonia placenta TaxID=104341 RepID=A0A8H7TWS9_9APHY|nr:hypothetical protein IEO21_10437 [Postia placenta]